MEVHGSKSNNFGRRQIHFWYLGSVWLIIKRSKRKFRKFWILTILDPIFEKGGPWAQKSKFGSQTNYFWYVGSKWIFMNRSKRKSRKCWILAILDPIFENGDPWAKSHKTISLVLLQIPKKMYSKCCQKRHAHVHIVLYINSTTSMVSGYLSGNTVKKPIAGGCKS